ncbi:MAG: aroK [Ilumatobacteraceae bacterium]|nr:aroK [Ilumatobacteraceae bacterium]
MPDTAIEVRPTHVVLVGLMGSGKTTVGKKVAKLVGARFVDADVEIEARTGRSVASWFEDGEPAFRAAEAQLLADLLADPDLLVLGSGGGVVVTEANRTRLQERDVTAVYLHGTPEFLASRVQAKAHRPLLDDDPLAVMTQMYAQRDGWYREVADAVIEVRPHHEAGEKPKWRIAEQVVTELVALGAVDAAAVTRPEAFG